MICPNENCGQEFDYKEVGTIYPGGKEKEPYFCPRCGEIAGYAMTSAHFESYAIFKKKKD